MATLAATFVERTGWQIEVLWLDEPLPFKDNDEADGLNQQQVLDMVRSALGEDCLKVSVDVAAHSLTVRFAFPDIARQRYADVLPALQEQTGWAIVVYPHANQQALAQTVAQLLPAHVHLLGTPSIYQDTQHVAITCTAPLAPEQTRHITDAFAATTGWTLEVGTRQER
ncbi:MAG: hypothetical protein HC876_05605 [Chloroflexaceae bacterium]|nr:hypothetical protein [Chloroflexaceae bacterium]